MDALAILFVASERGDLPNFFCRSELLFEFAEKLSGDHWYNRLCPGSHPLLFFKTKINREPHYKFFFFNFRKRGLGKLVGALRLNFV